MTAISFSDRDGWIWLDGKLVEWRAARAHVLDHALHYGSSVFEGVRSYDGVPFRLAEHAHRLVRSAELLGLDLTWTAADIHRASLLALDAAGGGDAYIRPVAWRGADDMGIAASGRSHLAVACWTWPDVFADADEAGIAVTVSRWTRPAPASAPYQAKAAGLYVICTLARQEAERAGFNDALMLDHEGRLAEATGANLFIVEGSRVITPPPTSFLDGITRRTILGLARSLGIPVAEETIDLDRLHQADAVFLTGTAYEVRAVRRVDGTCFPPSSITDLLRDCYLRLVRRGCPGAAR